MTDRSRASLAEAVGERDHAEGSETASVTLVEYGDYQCPYCRSAVPIVEDLRRLLGDRVRFVFRHFPLANIHPRAFAAAEAAEAAGAQGRFFEMHARLFEGQEALEDDDLLAYALELGLDSARFERELLGHIHRPRVEHDLAVGLASGVRGTPTFYLDGIRYDDAIGVRQLVAAIRRGHPGLLDDDVEEQLGRRIIPRVVTARSPIHTAAP